MSTPGSSSHRLRQLDGLRTIAVLMVFLLHHGIFSLGAFGVDVFFVLSGYLITGILRKDRSRTGYWRAFYFKRVTRILPPVVLILIITLAVQRRFSWGYLGYLLFFGNVMNFTHIANAYFFPLWSLAVEEHFYLFWPFAVRYLNRRQLALASLAIILVSPLVRAIATAILLNRTHSPTIAMSWIYVLTPFRLDGLALGSLLALLQEHGFPDWLKRSSGLSAVGVTALFVGLQIIAPDFRRGSGSVSFNAFGYSLVSLASFFCIAYLVAEPSAWLSKILANRALVYLGMISYGLYLYQTVPEVWTEQRAYFTQHAGYRMLLDGIGTILVAALSYHLIELPIIRWGKAKAEKTRRASPTSGTTLEGATT